jgi:hypothetical protein
MVYIWESAQFDAETSTHPLLAILIIDDVFLLRGRRDRAANLVVPDGDKCVKL